jgi:hypothetical protein
MRRRDLLRAGAGIGLAAFAMDSPAARAQVIPQRPGGARTLAELRATEGAQGDFVMLLPSSADGQIAGGGLFYWDPASVQPDDGGTVIGKSSKGRWLRIWDGELHAAWFGVGPEASGVQNATALNRAIQACPAGGSVVLPTGRLKVDGAIVCKSNTTLRGQYDQSQQTTKETNCLVYAGQPGKDFITLDNGSVSFVGLNVDGASCARVFNVAGLRCRWLDCVVRGGDIGVFLDSPTGATWNGEHRIRDCSVEGQRHYGIRIDGAAAFDGSIESNVIYGYGDTGICFGDKSQIGGWMISGNHLYPGPTKTNSAGQPKRAFEVLGHLANCTVTANHFEGGVYLRATDKRPAPIIFTANRISMPDAVGQTGIDIVVDAQMSAQLIVTQNIVAIHPASPHAAVGIRITAGTGSQVIGRVGSNEFYGNVPQKYDLKGTPLRVID